MSLNLYQQSVGTTDTLLYSATGRTKLRLGPDLIASTTVVYVRHSGGTTTSNSYPWSAVVGSEPLEITLNAGDEVHAVVASGSVTLGLHIEW